MSQISYRLSIWTIWLGVLMASPIDSASAQLSDRGLPSRTYYLGIPSIYAADYQDAARHFERGASSAFKIGDERFMDSACYWTMAGECHYHLGNYAQALVYYERTIQLLNNYCRGDWIDRIVPDQLQVLQRNGSAEQSARINWYRSTRSQGIARIPSSFTMLFGRLDANRVLVEGGTFQPAQLRGVDHAEIMRCCSLAIYRRYKIKGVTTQIDPLTNSLVSSVNRLPVGLRTIGKWNQMLRGLASMSSGRTDQAVASITAALQLENGLDHHLTPIGLMALARMAYEQSEPKQAAQFALEASYSAALYEQFDLVEESLSLGARVHMAENRTVYPPLTRAIDWATRSKLRKVQTSLQLSLADGLIEADTIGDAKEALRLARRSMARTDLNQGPLAGQLAFLNASTQFAETGDGFKALGDALRSYQPFSLWQLQLQLVASSFAAGNISQKQAETMYSIMLLDPGVRQWKNNPLETMTYMATPHVGLMEQWFELLLGRKSHDKAIEVAEKIRRHRFYETLPMSGRLMALRWMLTAPEETLTPIVQAQRAEFYKKYPDFERSVANTDQLIEQLRQLPLKPDEDSPEFNQQRDLYVEMLNVSQNQEAALAGVALRRQAANFVFPGAIDYSQIGESLKKHQVVIASLQTPAGYHQYAITKENRRYLGVVRERDMRRAVSDLLKKMGVTDAVNSVDAEVLQQSEWKEAALQLKQLLFSDFDDDQWSKYKEAIFIPDGLLWYVPMEVLQIGDDINESKNLNDVVKVRYLPMASLLVNETVARQADSRVAVVAGKVHPKAELSLSQRGFEELADSIINAQSYSRAAKIPSNLTNATTDLMVVWQDLKPAKNGPLGLAPFHADKNRPGSTLGQWMSAPWRGVQQIVLPGFNSNGAAGIRSRSDGRDLFLTTTGLMVSGVRSILISRWNPGGKNSIDISRQYAVESRQTSTIEALELAVQTARKQEIVFADEIRVKPPRKNPQPFVAEHPFFWAGNMLVDLTGYSPPADPEAADDDDPDKPAADDDDAAGDAGKDDDNAAGDGSDAKDPPAAEGSDSKEDGSATKEGSASKEQEAEGSGDGSGTKNEGSADKNEEEVEGSGSTYEGSGSNQ